MIRSALSDKYGNPVSQSHFIRAPSLDAGSFRGSISNWTPKRTFSKEHAASERALAHARASDLYINDWAAKSMVDTISSNAVGSGLVPQSNIPWQKLGLTRQQSVDLQNEMELAWKIWCENAHFRGQMHFDDLQLLAIKDLLKNSEIVHIPVMAGDDIFSLKIQDVLSERLSTPSDKQPDKNIRDGVEIDELGRPVAYWLASPAAQSFDSFNLSSANYRRIPAKIAHRRGLFHIFRANASEQYRGISILAPAMKMFRHLNDAIDLELLAQNLAASFPVFIALENGTGILPSDILDDSYNSTPEVHRLYTEIEGGQIMYGNAGEKPQVLESKRPNQNFQNFCKLVLRFSGASAELPYEAITKDFSETNYSSARAALLEAWRAYMMWRKTFTRNYTQPVWRMVQEEAWLRGMYKLPANAPDFYEAMHLWCNAKWIGPARGYIDPVKEINANIAAIQNNLMTRSEALAERGADFSEVMDEIAEEKIIITSLGLKDHPENINVEQARGNEIIEDDKDNDNVENDTQNDDS